MLSTNNPCRRKSDRDHVYNEKNYTCISKKKTSREKTVNGLYEHFLLFHNVFVSSFSFLEVVKSCEICCRKILYIVSWLVVLGFNATLTAKVISWRWVTHMFPGFLTPVLTQLFFPEPPTTFLTCFSSGEKRKCARKKVRLNRVSNSQPPGHESDTLTTEPPGRGTVYCKCLLVS